MLFPAAECWKSKPSVENYMTDLLHGFSKHTTRVYSRGQPSDPIYPPPFLDVLRQLDKPDLSSTQYAINIAAESAEVKIPERLVGHIPVYQDNNLITTTNVTPRFSAAELHVGKKAQTMTSRRLIDQAPHSDHGKHGVTLLNRGCVKLWALYPLTPHNLAQFSALHKSNAAFIELQGNLEGGEFCLQTEYQAIYLPPGCIHGTYTLQGGLTPGIGFTTVECLEPAANMWDLDSKGLRLHGNDCYPLLEAIIMGLRCEKEDRREKAVQLLCPKYRRLCKLNPGILSKVKKELPRVCSECDASWAKH